MEYGEEFSYSIYKKNVANEIYNQNLEFDYEADYENLFDYLKTPLTESEERAFQMSKSISPFASDSGDDYDLRGYWKKYGTLNPTASNGHLTDEFKLPNHRTFSNESRYFNGQPWAVDWQNPHYDTLGRLGLL